MRMKKKGSGLPGGQGACLMAMLTLFMVGAVVGSFFAANISGAGQAYIQRLLATSAPAGWSGIAQVAGLEAGLLLVVFASAFFPLGLVLAPLALGVKGFMLSMLASAFVKTLGPRGYAASLALVLLLGFVSATCLVLVGLQAMEAARQRTVRGHRRRVFIDRAYYITAGICLGLTLLSAAAYCYITPLVGRMVTGLG